MNRTKFNKNQSLRSQIARQQKRNFKSAQRLQMSQCLQTLETHDDQCRENEEYEDEDLSNQGIHL
jgi:hypothetical protein